MPIHDWTKVAAGTFHNFHLRWIASIMDRLNAGVLPPGYFAMAEQYVGRPEADVVALREEDDLPDLRAHGAQSATVTEPQTRYVVSAKPGWYARKANRVAVHHGLGNVVAVIEVVPPGNKSSRREFEAFVEKATLLIHRGAHLLVVDLFPPFRRDPKGIHKAIWDEVHEEPFDPPADQPLTVVSYRAEPGPTAYVEPVAVGDRLPDAPLFLTGEHYVNVPLEETYAATWNVLPAVLRNLVENPR